jgi:hypothetical protein
LWKLVLLVRRMMRRLLEALSRRLMNRQLQLLLLRLCPQRSV